MNKEQAFLEFDKGVSKRDLLYMIVPKEDVPAGSNPDKAFFKRIVEVSTKLNEWYQEWEDK